MQIYSNILNTDWETKNNHRTHILFLWFSRFLGNIHEFNNTTSKDTPNHVLLQDLYVGVDKLSEITKKPLCEVLLAQALISGLVSTLWIHIQYVLCQNIAFVQSSCSASNSGSTALHRCFCRKHTILKLSLW